MQGCLPTLLSTKIVNHSSRINCTKFRCVKADVCEGVRDDTCCRLTAVEAVFSLSACVYYIGLHN